MKDHGDTYLAARETLDLLREQSVSLQTAVDTMNQALHTDALLSADGVQKLALELERYTEAKSAFQTAAQAAGVFSETASLKEMEQTIEAAIQQQTELQSCIESAQIFMCLTSGSEETLQALAEHKQKLQVLLDEAENAAALREKIAVYVDFADMIAQNSIVSIEKMNKFVAHFGTTLAINASPMYHGVWIDGTQKSGSSDEQDEDSELRTPHSSEAFGITEVAHSSGGATSAKKKPDYTQLPEEVSASAPEITQTTAEPPVPAEQLPPEPAAVPASDVQAVPAQEIPVQQPVSQNILPPSQFDGTPNSCGLPPVQNAFFEAYGKLTAKGGRVPAFKKDISNGIRKQICLLIMAYLTDFGVLSPASAFVYIYPIVNRIIGGADALCSVNDVRECCELLTRRGYLTGYTGICPDQTRCTFYTMAPAGLDIVHSETGYYLLSNSGVHVNTAAVIPTVATYSDFLKIATLCRLHDTLYACQPPAPLYYSTILPCGIPADLYQPVQDAPMLILPLAYTMDQNPAQYAATVQQLQGLSCSMVVLLVPDLSAAPAWLSFWQALTGNLFAGRPILCCDHTGRLSDGSLLYPMIVQMTQQSADGVQAD